MFGSWIRRTGFWTLDALKGGPVRKHYKDIAFKMAQSNNGPDAGQLTLLLEHTKRSTPFYRELNRQKPLLQLDDFPVVTKADFLEQYEAFQSDEYSGRHLHQMFTSGSTGVPFTANQDMNKRKRVLAKIIYFNEICGHKLGDRYLYFRLWTPGNRKTKWEQFKQNFIPVHVVYLTDNELEKIRQLLIRDKSIHSVLTYASTFEYLTSYMKACGDTPDMYNIKLVITGSETIDMHVKQRIKEVMGCRVIDRYSNQENGIIAQTGDLSNVFTVNFASYYVELLKLDSDEEASEGDLARIVVTDLYNFAMPMIRYDTGDLAVKHGNEKGGARQFKSVQGRKSDVFYDTRGNRITPLAWGAYMERFDRFKQYQFIQEDAKKYIFKANVAEGIYSKDEIIEVMKNALGDDAEIDVQFVDAIPVLASGKFKRTICNYHPKELDV